MVTLDLSDNCITSINGLSQLHQLTTFNVSHNRIEMAIDIKGLLQCPSLTNIDISYNQLYQVETMSVLEEMPLLKSLRITGKL